MARRKLAEDPSLRETKCYICGRVFVPAPQHVYHKYGKVFPIHGQGIYHCQRTKDTALIKQEELYDWCCLYPNTAGHVPFDFPENFEYCLKHHIHPCVCVPDEIDTYKKYIDLGCRMFTSNNIYKAAEILRELHFRA